MSPRHERQSFLGAQSQKVIESSIVGIVGLGGGGSHVAQQLAHVGFKQFKLFDGDSVEESNLNRLVGAGLSDAAQRVSKLDIIRRAILHVQPTAVVNCYQDPWQSNHEELRLCSLIFGCVDSFSSRDQLEAYARRFLLPYIDIGMDIHEVAGGTFAICGQIITSLPGRPCMRCSGFINDARLAQEAQRYGAAGNRPQVVWSNGVLASTAVGVGMNILLPWHKDEVCIFIEYDGNRNELKRSPVLAYLQERDCLHYPREAVGDMTWPAATMQVNEAI